MNTDSVSATVALLLAAEPDVADRDEVAVIVRRSRSVRSWLDSVDVACARRTRELAAAGRAEPAESLLDDQGQRSSRDSVTINKRVPACDAMPLFEAALAAGEISGGHVDAVAAVLVGLDDEIRAEFIAEQPALLAAARRERVEEFLAGCRNLIRFLTAQRDQRTGIDTEAAELEHQRAASKIRQWTDTQSRMHHTHIELDPIRGAKLRKALADMLRRHRSVETNTGVPWNQLEVDSFLNGIARAVTTRPDTTSTGTPTTDAPTTDAPSTGSDETGTARSTETTRAGSGIATGSDETTGDTDETAGDATANPSAAAPNGGDGHACSCGHDAGAANGAGGAAGSTAELRIPEIGVFIDLPTLLDGLHEHSICETYDGIAVPVSQVRRMCCDANIIPYVLDGNSQVTDLGRSTRTINRAQRRKLRGIHKTCVGDNCHVTFEHCEIHHVIFWRFKGPTDISNLVPVCSRHHHLAHEGGWTLTMTPDRIVTWTRPDSTTHSTHDSKNRPPRRTNGRRRRRTPTKQTSPDNSDTAHAGAKG